MKRSIKAAVVALAFTGLVAQPMVANAGITCYTPPTGSNVGPLPIIFVTGFFLCAGMSLGKQDVDAAKNGTTVTKRDRAHAFLGCLLPFHHKHVDAVSAKG
jgi:hypothetical protein